jgi:hypothetical protein
MTHLTLENRLDREQNLRLRCLEMANIFGINEGLCEHSIQQVAGEYFNYVMTGEKSVHEEGILDHVGKTFQA